MAIQIISNINYPIGNIINQELASSNEAKIAVAFLKYSGLDVIEKSLIQTLKNNGIVEIIAGLDFKTTDPKAMFLLLKLKEDFENLHFFCYGDKKENKTNIVFHPKLYLFKNKAKTTGIVGSTNLTRGGLLTNFETNVIFSENKPIYFSQIEAVYNSIKYTDSIFMPDMNYVNEYSSVYKAFSANEIKANKDGGIKDAIKEINKYEKVLPGTIPSLKKLIIQVIEKELENNDFVALNKIYENTKKIVIDKNLSYKMDTFENSIRGELNKHEDSSKHPDNMHLFIRSTNRKGLYSLTQKGINYEGR